MLRASLSAELEYRANFVLMVVMGIVWQSSVLVFATVLIARFPGLGGWSKGDLLLLAAMRMLSHGLCFAVFKNVRFQPVLVAFGLFGLAIGTSQEQWTPAKAASASAEDLDAARKVDGMSVRIFLDALVHGRYPRDVLDDLDALGVGLPVRDGDLDLISTPIDLLGINYYFGQMFTGAPETPGAEPTVRRIRRDLPRTATGWEIIPEELTELLVRLAKDYPGLPLYVTENGAAFDDAVGPHGEIADRDRTAFLADHLAAVGDAIAVGADVRGYFVWTLMDNFEWYSGYTKRFGLYRVDFENQRRTLKASGTWFRDAVRSTRERG
jgi:beta-glucosidase